MLTHKVIRIEFSFCLFAAMVLLVFPLKLILAWGLAVAVHEISHYIAIKLCGVDIIDLTIGAAGVNMQTVPMSKKQELACALAGPLGGFCLLLVARWLPYTAICAFIHSLFNLFPIYPLDGGRALRCVIYWILGDRYGALVCAWVRNICIVLLLAAGLYLIFRLNLGLPSVVFVALLFLKFKLANKQNK